MYRSNWNDFNRTKQDCNEHLNSDSLRVKYYFLIIETVLTMALLINANYGKIATLYAQKVL